MILHRNRMNKVNMKPSKGHNHDASIAKAPTREGIGVALVKHITHVRKMRNKTRLNKVFFT